MASDVDWDSSASVERQEFRRRSRAKGHAGEAREGGVQGLVRGVKELVTGDKQL